MYQLIDLDGLRWSETDKIVRKDTFSFFFFFFVVVLFTQNIQHVINLFMTLLHMWIYSLLHNKVGILFQKLSFRPQRINLLYTGRLFHYHMLDEPICHFRVVGSISSLLFCFFYGKSC